MYDKYVFFLSNISIGPLYSGGSLVPTIKGAPVAITIQVLTEKMNTRDLQDYGTDGALWR